MAVTNFDAVAGAVNSKFKKYDILYSRTTSAGSWGSYTNYPLAKLLSDYDFILLGVYDGSILSSTMVPVELFKTAAKIVSNYTSNTYACMAKYASDSTIDISMVGYGCIVIGCL